VPGETVWRVPSLATPDPQCALSREGLMHYEAVQLFMARATAVLPAFTVTPKQASWVVQICHRLDGIPLALELAATCVKVLSVAQIAGRLDQCFQLLTGGSRTALPRQQTLQATIDWSYALLSAPERSVWRRLSVFAGGWTLEAAEQVCAGADVEAAAVLGLLASLVDKSLVLVGEQAGQARYRLLETMRQYGTEKLREAGETVAVHQRHQDWYLRLAEQAEQELEGAEQHAWLERLEHEHDNLRAALAWSTEHASETDAGVWLAGTLGRFWSVRGYWSEGYRWLQTVLARSAGTSPAARAKALYGAGTLSEDQSNYAVARTFYEESLGLQRVLGDQCGIANSLNRLGFVACWQGDYALARGLHEESLAIRQALGDQSGIAYSRSGLGDVATAQGAYAVARGHYQESLAMRREVGDQRSIALSLKDLGRVATAQADYTLARGFYEESLTIRQALGDQRGIANALGGLGDVAAAQGEYAVACARYQESLALLWGLKHKRRIAECLEGLAKLASAQGQPTQAARIYGTAEALREALGAPLAPPERALYDRTVAAVRAALDEPAFTTAWAAGRAMTLEQAIVHALEAPSSSTTRPPTPGDTLP
jgi:predicted ATPase